MAMPTMVVLLAVFQAVGAQIMWAMVAFGVMLSPGFYRLVRNQVMSVKNELYVDAARVSGLTDARIIGRHILLVVRAPVVIQAAHVAGLAITMQSGLEFLGLGNPKSPTWGGMLQNGFQNIYNAPTAIIWPGLAIAFTVASLMLLGNAVRDAIQRSGEASVAKRSRRTASSSTRESGSGGPSSVATVTTSSAGEISTTPGDGGRADGEVLLSVRDLTIGYPHGEGFTKVVENVSLDVRQGEVLGLVGESGSGKTQTVFAILGLLPLGGTILDGSSIRFGGRELTGLPEREYEKLRGRRLAYVPQEPMSNLDPCYRVGYQLVEPMRRHLGLSTRAARGRALDLLERVGIPDPQRTFMAYPHEVSGGMAQRVLIAGAVSCDPELLIADEPTTALDVTVQAEVLDLLRDLQAEFNMSVLLVTHNFGVVADICHRVAVMQLGHVVETNDVVTLFAEPQHPYTRMLLDSTLEGSTPRAYQPVLGGLR
jgi:peptide/nickel transport system permease protein